MDEHRELHTIPGAFAMPDSSSEIQSAWLARLGLAPAYNRWLFEQFSPFVHDRVLEIGCGTGTFTTMLATLANAIVAVEISPVFASIAREANCRFGHVRIETGDATKRVWAGGFGTVVMLDVLEHLPDEKSVLSAVGEALDGGGHLILKVPAFQALYGSIDRAVGHHRRYTVSSLTHLLSDCGFSPVRMVYFNALAMLGWWVNGKLLGRSAPPAQQLKLFERAIPFVKCIDIFMQHVAGLSIIAIARKNV